MAESKFKNSQEHFSHSAGGTGHYLPNPGEFANASSFLSLIPAFTPVPDRFLLHKAAPRSDQITQLTHKTEDVIWQHHAGCWQFI